MDKTFINRMLWACANSLRGSIDAASYKNIVLGLLFLRALPGNSEEPADSTELNLQGAEDHAATREDSLHYLAVPAEARWSSIVAAGKQSRPGEGIDAAFSALEEANPSLAGALPIGYSTINVPARKIAEIIEHISRIGETAKHQGIDVLGEVYEYFLGQFAALEGQKGGEFYTPSSLVRLLVESLAPITGPIYDPCCGSGSMFVYADQYVRTSMHNGSHLEVFGQESNPNTWKLARMNLALRGISGDLGHEAHDTFICDLHKDKRAHYVLANPPFNMSRWDDGHAESQSWPYGTPKPSSANFAWIQKILQHLEDGGTGAIILSNGTLSSDSGGDGQIRRELLEGGVVDAVIQLPSQLFWNTQISACVWILSTNRSRQHASDGREVRLRKSEVLFIEASELGSHIDKTHKTFSTEDISRIASTYRAWRGDPGFPHYSDVPGFCRSETIATIRYHRGALVPGRYVGFSDTDRVRTDRSHIDTLLSTGASVMRRLIDRSTESIHALEKTFDG